MFFRIRTLLSSKSITKILCSAIVLVGLAGCGKSPRTVAKTFLEDFRAGNYAEAKKTAKLDMYQKIDFAAEMLKPGGLGAELEGNMKGDHQLSFVDEQIQGDGALVTFHSGRFNYNQSVQLQKIDGKWLVSEVQPIQKADALNSPPNGRMDGAANVKPRGTPNPADASRKQALKMYPALGVSGSPFNSRFTAAYNETQTSNPELLTHDDWPMQLAKRVNQELGGGN